MKNARAASLFPYGRRAAAVLEAVGDGVLFAGRAARATFSRPFYLSLALEQFRLLVVKSAPLVLVTATSTGAVMALQFGYGMERFGGKLYVPTVVALSIVRVLGPVFTCLMLAGRAGAGVAAELGSMQVTQQVDAIRALGTDPIKKLVVPRVLALTVGAPLLTLLADVAGIAGGMAVSTAALGFPPLLYVRKSYDALAAADMLVGTGKTVFFGAFIGIASSLAGLRTREGTVGIGHATTRAVVACSVFIMVGDVLFTKLSWILKW